MGTSTTTAATLTGNKLLSTEDLEGTRVLGAKGDEIDTIDHLMVDRENGQVVYVISFLPKLERRAEDPEGAPV